MNQALTQLQNELPLPADQLADKFPFCGPLQWLKHSPNDADWNDQTRQTAFLYFANPASLTKVAGITTDHFSVDTNAPTPATTSGEVPLFEPYHTVDYFASQGIKAPVLDDPKDKFGQQLKSFTDWLKVMKRLPLTEITKQIPVEQEKQVADLAHHSLDEKQVWTEAMAEVWAKQGERQKAIRIYEKLSLLEPSKSAYFAGKIDALKKES